MYIAFTVVFFVCVIVVQTTVLRFISIEEIIPDLVLILVVYLGLVKGSNFGCISGFFFGLVEDICSDLYLGSNALTKTIIGFFCGISSKRIYTQSLFAQMLCVGIGTIVDVLLRLSINGFVLNWRRLLLYETLYNIVCCPGLVMLFRQGEKRLGLDASPPDF